MLYVRDIASMRPLATVNVATCFYPRDAMLARVLAMTCVRFRVYACVCLSVTSRCSIKRNKRINLLFGTEASHDQSYTAI